MRWSSKCINDHSKIIMPGFRMLAFNVWKGRVLSKLLKVSSLSQKSYLKNKNSTKSFSEFFSNKS